VTQGRGLSGEPDVDRRGDALNLPEAAVVEGLAGALICAVIGSIFATMESAFSALAPSRLSALDEEAKGASKASLQRYLKNPKTRHSQWLVGRVVFTSLSAVLVANCLAPFVPRPALVPLGALGALLTYGILAEIGTTLGRGRPEYFATHILPLMRPLELLVVPLAAPLAVLGRVTSRQLGPVDARRDARLTETEVEWVVTEGQKAGSLGEEPAEMIRNVLELKDLTARDVMVPRTQVGAIEVDTPLPEVLRIIASEGHSRFPVYREKIDNIVGLLYAKDLFRVLNDAKLENTPLGELVRAPVNFVPEMQGVSSVLREMRARRLHMAVVIDEFGGVAGIVTLEDILEVIVGDIRDEYDTEEAPIQDLGDGRLLADAAVSIHDLSTYLAAEIPESGEYESLGGLLIHQAGKVPPVGAEIAAFGLSFIIRDADEKRISKVEIVRPGNLSEPAPPLSTRSPPAEAPPATSSEGGKKPDSDRKIASAAT
jgi:CBS domain containing-hemolysin-like protein